MTREPMSPELEELLEAERSVDELPRDVHDGLRTAIRARIHTGGDGGDDGGGDSGGGGRGGAGPAGLAKMLSMVLLGATLGYGVRWAQEPIVENEGAPPEQTERLPLPDGVGERVVAAGDTPETTPVPEVPPTTEPHSVRPLRRPRPVVVPSRREEPDEAPREVSREAARPERILIDRARSALRQRAFGEVLSTLLRHETEYPRGSLVEDRDALRIRALQGLGQRERAQRAFERFAARYPTSPYRETLAQELER